MVTHRRYLGSDDIAASNPYLSAPISTRRNITSGLISIECLVYFWICLTLPKYPLCFIQSRTARLPLFHIFIKAVCPTRSFIIWLILWRQLIHFSHGPTCLCSSMIHSFTRPTLIPICSQIVLTLLIPFVLLSFPFWADVPQYGRTIG